MKIFFLLESYWTAIISVIKSHWRAISAVVAVLVAVLVALCVVKPDWTAIGAVATAVGTIVALYFGVYNIRIVVAQHFFKEIKEYFNVAIKDLNDVMASDFRNNCIKWHMALNKILAAQHLACKLKIVEYKILYVYLCQQIAFDIQNVIFSIEGYRFFYGVKNYEGREDKELYQISYPDNAVSSDDLHSRIRRDGFRIAPDLLSFIVRFLQNSNQYRSTLVCDMSKKEINSFLNPLESVEFKPGEFNSNISPIAEYINKFQETRQNVKDQCKNVDDLNQSSSE